MVFCIPLDSLDLALICFSQKFAKGGDCWVFVLAALLLKQISLLCKLEPMFQHVFRHFRTFHICFWFLFCRLAEPICFVLKPNLVFSPGCFSIQGRLQDLIAHSNRHTEKFRFLGFWVFMYSALVSCWCKFRIFTVFSFLYRLWYLFRTLCEYWYSCVPHRSCETRCMLFVFEGNFNFVFGLGLIGHRGCDWPLG